MEEAQTSGRAKLLIVDDKLLFLKSFEHFLSHVGYEVKSAFNGVEAVKCLEENNFDLVITDIRMPGMDGIELLKRIAAMKKDLKVKRDLIVIVLTAFASVEMKEQAISWGACEYMEKPIRLERIEEVIKNRLLSLKK